MVAGAKQCGKARFAGHSEGVKVSKEIVRWASERGLPFLVAVCVLS